MGDARNVLCKNVLIVLSCSPVPRGFSLVSLRRRLRLHELGNIVLWRSDFDAKKGSDVANEGGEVLCGWDSDVAWRRKSIIYFVILAS